VVEDVCGGVVWNGFCERDVRCDIVFLFCLIIL
jgi:hypothetical protein